MKLSKSYKALLKSRDFIDKLITKSQKKCYTCDGSGIITPGDNGYHYKTCRDCDGRGYNV